MKKAPLRKTLSQSLTRLLTITLTLGLIPLGAVWGATGGPNLGSTVPDNAFDGNTSTFWQGSYDSTSWYLQEDYGVAGTIQTVTIDYYSTSFRPNSASLQVSVDGTNWTTVGTFPYQDPSSLNVGANGRHIKINMSGLNPSTAYTPAVREVTMTYGTGASGGPYETGHGPELAFDSSASTYFQGTSGSSWELNMSYIMRRHCDQVRVTYTGTSYVPQRADLLVSNDGNTYTSVGTFPAGITPSLTVPSPYAYHRIDMSGLSAQGYAPRVTEVHCIPASGVSGGVSLNANTLPAKAFDGNTSTLWQGSYSFTAWELIQDLGASSPMGTVQVDYYDSRFMPAEATLFTSTDGLYWTDRGALPDADPAALAVNGDARYLRVEMEGRNPTTAYSPAVLEVTAQVTGDGANGGPTIGTAVAAKAFDDNTTTFWQGSYAATTWNLGYTFEEITPVGLVTIDYYSANFIPAAAYLQTSEDGFTWTTVGTMPEADPSQLSVSVGTRYIRVLMEGLDRDTNYTPAVREMDITPCVSGSGGLPLSGTSGANAFDGSSSTIFQGSYSTNAWAIGKDLTTTIPFGGLSLSYYDSRFIPQTATVYTSGDGLIWTSLGNLPASTTATLSQTVSQRYVKIVMSGKNSSSGYTAAVKEVSFIPPSAAGGGPSLGTGVPSKAFDTSLSTFWQGDYSATSWFITYDHGTPRSLEEVEVIYYNSSFIPASAAVDVSNDGLTWTALGNLPSSVNAVLSVAVASHRYLRIRFTGLNPTSAYTPAVKEVYWGDIVSGGPSITTSALPSKAYDSQAGTFWQGASSTTAWALDFDFGSAQTITSVTVDYHSCDFTANAVTVQVSDNRTSWTTVGTLALTDPAYLAVGQSRRFVRLAMAGKDPETAYSPALSEVTFNLAAPSNPTSCVGGCTTEVCDGEDNDCDGLIDEECVCASEIIPAGSFTRGNSDYYGDSDEDPALTVYVSAFEIDTHEVTNGEYQDCVAASACTAPANLSSLTRGSYYGNGAYDNYPVLHVTWSQAYSYCNWRGWRLPTAAEWEKAARGSADMRPFPWGGTRLSSYPYASGISCNEANYTESCVGDTAEVCSYEDGRSPYGLYEMSGNAWEWVYDLYDQYYYYCCTNPTWQYCSTVPGAYDNCDSDPTGPPSGFANKEIRGGSFYYGTEYARVTDRYNGSTSYESGMVGFRCARDY